MAFRRCSRRLFSSTAKIIEENQMLREVTPMEIQYNQSNEVLYLGYNEEKASNCFLQAEQGALRWQWLRALLHCHVDLDVKSCSQGFKDEHMGCPSEYWVWRPLGPCQVKAFERAGTISSVELGLLWKDEQATMAIDKSQQSRVLAEGQWHGETAANNKVATGYHIFSAPLQAVEYDAIEFLDPCTRVPATICRTNFLEAAQSRGRLSRRKALVLLDDIEAKQAIRPCVIMDLDAVGGAKVARFWEHGVQELEKELVSIAYNLTAPRDLLLRAGFEVPSNQDYSWTVRDFCNTVEVWAAST